MGESDVLLPDHEFHQVLADRILPTWTAGAVCQDRPVVVFVAGQPGSGKTAIADLVRPVLDRRGGAVRIGADLYKSLHRHYAEALARDVRTAGAVVRADTRRWQAELEAHVRDRGFDAVVETALADVDTFRVDVAAYRRAGFRVEVLALATPEAWSQLGILARYVTGAVDGRGRYVSWDNHDACARALPRVLAVVEAEGLADRVTVVRRDASVVYANEAGADGEWVRAPGADAALVAERTRPWTAPETIRFRAELIDTDRRLHREPPAEDHRLAVRRDADRAAALAEPVRRIARAIAEPPGVDYHRLSTAEHTRIFDELLVPKMGEVTAHERPVAVYIMGQPGAGKTRAAHLAHRAMRHRRPVRITAEDFKAAHPDYPQLLREHPRTAGERIRVDYRAWRDQAMAYVRARRGDMIVEISPGSAEAFLADVAADRRAGYRIELVVLAVREADSRQGTAARYAEVSGSGPARFTTVSGHDRCLRAVLDSVHVAEHGASVDSVTVMRRDHTAVYRNELGLDGRWAHSTGAVWALLGEQRRPYTPGEAAEFLSIHRRLTAVLPQHRSELADIARLAAPLMPATARPRPLATPTSRAGLPVPSPRTASKKPAGAPLTGGSAATQPNPPTSSGASSAGAPATRPPRPYATTRRHGRPAPIVGIRSAPAAAADEAVTVATSDGSVANAPRAGPPHPARRTTAHVRRDRPRPRPHADTNCPAKTREPGRQTASRSSLSARFHRPVSCRREEDLRSARQRCTATRRHRAPRRPPPCHRNGTGRSARRALPRAAGDDARRRAR
ncbi:Ni2+-binding GTPase involved in maturation of urease and hydrogenase [Embleya sp. AB8]